MSAVKTKYLYLLIIFLIFLTLIFVHTVLAVPRFQLIYIVEEGDTLIGIAGKFGITVRELRSVNGLSDGELIKIGDRLVIPIEEERPSFAMNVSLQVDNLANKTFNLEDTIRPVIIKKKLPRVNIPDSKLITYHIKPGDTLYELAREFNTSLKVLKALNQLEDEKIRIGQQLLLPINNLTPREVIQKTISARELELLARVIYGEARGEPFIGQVAVGAVVINRVLSSRFPDTFYGVIYQPGQFTCVADGQINLQPDSTAYRAAREALRGIDPTLGALYYYNPKTARNRWWFKNRRTTVTIGNHVFAR